MGRPVADWTTRLAGDARTVLLEHRIARILALVVGVANAAFALMGVPMGWPPTLFVLLPLIAAGCAFFYWRMRFHGDGYRAFVICFACSQLVVYLFSYFELGALQSPTLVISMVVPFMVTVLMPGRLRLVFIGALTVVIWTLVIAGLARPEWVIPRPPVVQAVDQLVSWTAMGWMLAFVVGTVVSALHAEREKNETLLLNVLPRSIAERLKRDPDEVIADSFDDCTIVFVDLVGFTPMSERLPPADVVRLLDQLFTGFDELAERHGLEKIRTIGDAWMAVAGCPEPHEDTAGAVAEVALGIRAIVDRHEGIDVRIGAATGPVVGAVVGRNKYHYDVWGDAVNTAARMESHGVPGRIQVTAETAGRLRGRFELVERGPIEVKGKGTMTTWFLEGPVQQPQSQ